MCLRIAVKKSQNGINRSEGNMFDAARKKKRITEHSIH